MKNYKTIFFTLITSAFLLVGFVTSYYGEYVQFGTARWKDTLSNRITTNKAINLRPGDSLYYNGNVVTSGSGTSIDTNKYLSIYRLDTSKIGFLNQGNQWSELNEFTDMSVSNSFQNIGSSTLADVTITGNVDVSSDVLITGYTRLGVSGPKIAMKVVRGKITTAGAYLTIAHGLGDYKMIRGLDFTLLRDTTGSTERIFNIGYNASTPLSVGFVLSADTTNIRYYCSPNSTALIGDSIRVLITYEY